MSKKLDKNILRRRKARRVKDKVRGTNDRPRMVVYRSARQIYVQLVDDNESRTLAATSTMKKELSNEVSAAKTKTDAGKIIGMDIAKMAKALKINKVVFDRNGYLYHGRVKAVAEGAREGGLEF